jgi:hypothetical protein
MIRLKSKSELINAFKTLGSVVGPRRGPHRRTKDDKEWYCLNRYLRSLAQHDLLSYPLCITKSERPDFKISDNDRGTYGIEVTEATEEDWQAELSRFADSLVSTELIGGGDFLGDSQEIGWCETIIRSIEKKLRNLMTSSAFEVNPCDLLIYVNSRMSLGVDEDKAFKMLFLRTSVILSNACPRLGYITVLTNSRMMRIFPDIIAY